MTKIDDEELKRLLVQHPGKPNSYYAKYFKCNAESIRRKRKNLEKKVEAIVQYDQKRNVEKVVTSTKDKLEDDIEQMRRAAMQGFKELWDAGDRKGAMAWWDRWNNNAKLRVDISKSLTIMIDQRQVNVTITPDMIGKGLWAYLEMKGLLKEALEYLRQKDEGE